MKIHAGTKVRAQSEVRKCADESPGQTIPYCGNLLPARFYRIVPHPGPVPKYRAQLPRSKFQRLRVQLRVPQTPIFHTSREHDAARRESSFDWEDDEKLQKRLR